MPTDSKTFHIVPVTFLAKGPKAAPGNIRAKLRIETDLAGASALVVDVSVQMVAEK